MAKPRGVTVSAYNDGQEIHVWNVSFRLKGSANQKQMRRLEKEIRKTMESLEFSLPGEENE